MGSGQRQWHGFRPQLRKNIDYQNYFKIRDLIPWRRTYFIVDTEDYLADQLFIEKKISVYFGREFIKRDLPYVVIEVKLQRKQEAAFLEAMEKLKRKMLLMGHTDYPELCMKIMNLQEKSVNVKM